MKSRLLVSQKLYTQNKIFHTLGDVFSIVDKVSLKRMLFIKLYKISSITMK